MTSNDFSEPNATSMTLLERLRQRDSEAWEKLVKLYHPLLAYWLNRFDIDSQTAEDIAQEVWRSVSLHVHEFRKEDANGTFRGWLWTITRNKVRDVVRRSDQRPMAMGGTEGRLMFESIPDAEPVTIDDPAGREVVRRALDVVKQDFTEQTWQAFSRMVLDGQDAVFVAQELGIKANAVHQARFRVLRRLREVLDGILEL